MVKGKKKEEEKRKRKKKHIGRERMEEECRELFPFGTARRLTASRWWVNRSCRSTLAKLRPLLQPLLVLLLVVLSLLSLPVLLVHKVPNDTDATDATEATDATTSLRIFQLHINTGPNCPHVVELRLGCWIAFPKCILIVDWYYIIEIKIINRLMNLIQVEGPPKRSSEVSR